MLLERERERERERESHCGKTIMSTWENWRWRMRNCFERDRASSSSFAWDVWKEAWPADAGDKIVEDMSRFFRRLCPTATMRDKQIARYIVISVHRSLQRSITRKSLQFLAPLLHVAIGIGINFTKFRLSRIRLLSAYKWLLDTWD